MSNQFERRRRHLPEFRDLFSALFKIPDPEVQSRVLNAINGFIDDTCRCKDTKKIVKVNASVQTDPIKMFVSNSIVVKKEVGKVFCFQNQQNQSVQTEQSKNVLNHIIKREPDLPVENGDDHNNRIMYYGDNGQYIKADTEEQPKNKEIRQRRKRTRRVPKAEKVTDPQATGFIKPVSSNDSEELTNSSESSSQCAKKQKIDAVDEHYWEKFFEDNDDALNQTVQDVCIRSEEDIVNLMKREYESCLKRCNGLLPIHNAILQNDIPGLKRQVYIFKFLNIRIGNLLTDDHYSPIQLAIKNDCHHKIIKILLDTNPDLYEIDSEENTLFHLIALNTNEHAAMRHVLNHDKDFKLEFLSQTNNDGYTPLHICVKLEKTFLLKTILEYINERLKIEYSGKGEMNETKLTEIYGKDINQFHDRNIVKLKREKMEIINKRDFKLGSTALLFAVKKNSKLLIVMLLANLADPNIKDYSETDCVNFANEYSRSHALISQIINTSIYLDKCKLEDSKKKM